MLLCCYCVVVVVVVVAAAAAVVVVVVVVVVVAVIVIVVVVSEGGWKHGKKEGSGIMLLADGSVVIGEYRNNETFGHIIMKLANGDV